MERENDNDDSGDYGYNNFDNSPLQTYQTKRSALTFCNKQQKKCVVQQQSQDNVRPQQGKSNVQKLQLQAVQR